MRGRGGGGEKGHGPRGGKEWLWRREGPTSDRSELKASALPQEVRDVLQLGNVVLSVCEGVNRHSQDEHWLYVYGSHRQL